MNIKLSLILVVSILTLNACVQQPARWPLPLQLNQKQPPRFSKQFCKEAILAHSRETFKDPTGIIVSNIRVGEYKALYIHRWNSWHFGYRVVASVNGKNSYGGYVGARDYIYLIEADKTCIRTNWYKHTTYGSFSYPEYGMSGYTIADLKARVAASNQ